MFQFCVGIVSFWLWQKEAEFKTDEWKLCYFRCSFYCTLLLDHSSFVYFFFKIEYCMHDHGSNDSFWQIYDVQDSPGILCSPLRHYILAVNMSRSQFSFKKTTHFSLKCPAKSCWEIDINRFYLIIYSNFANRLNCNL